MVGHSSRNVLKAVLICVLAVAMAVSNVSPVIYAPSTAEAALTQANEPAAQAAGPAANLDQCRNGTAASRNDCLTLGGGTGWVNGNVGASQGHFVEGYSIPYRMTFTGLTAESVYTVRIGYEVKQSGVNAIDFLTSYDRINDPLHLETFLHNQEKIDPTDGLLGDSAGTYGPPAADSTIAIPAPNLATGTGGSCTAVGGSGSVLPGATSCPRQTFDALAGTEKEISIWGATFDGSFVYFQSSAPDSQGKQSTEVELRFTATATSAVMAWGGHIARQADWGTNNSAAGISGSSYHMRLVGLCSGATSPCTSGGNQDRSLTAAAVYAQPTLTLQKVVSGGTAADTDWTLTATGPDTISGTEGSATVTNVIVKTGTYALSESGGPIAYASGSWSCSAGTLVGSSLTLTYGQDATCSITNTYSPTTAQLTLVKHVTNDNGGTAAATDWTLTATGPETISGVTGAAAVTSKVVSPGTYALSESTKAGYSGGSWSCVKNGGAPATGASITLAAGDSATCEITNDDIAPQLHLRKTVTNDNGGTAAATDWTLTATGTGASPTNLSGATPVDSGTTFKADTYALAETGGPSGYAPSSWSCVKNAAAPVTGASITLAVGDNATCTVTNDDSGATLTLVKNVTNDNGGTATVSSFPLTATGPQTITGVSGTAAVTNATVSAGTYTLSETTLATYAASAWSCVKNGGDPVTGASITLALGDSATCEITNDDIGAQLTVIKHVVNDDGGTAVASAWTMTISGVTSSGTLSFAGAESPGVTRTLTSVGSYEVTESAAPGYAVQYSADCQGTIALGESKTCTVTNDDMAAHLTLTKLVTNDNGGTKVPSDFTLAATGPTPLSGVSGSAAVTNAEVAPGTYTPSETPLAGYTAGTWSCVKDGPASLAVIPGTSVTLGLGESATCTITNNDIAPTLHLVKQVVNDNGGAKVAADWTLTATGPTTLTGTAPVDSTATFSAGTYTLSESTVAGYGASAWSCVKNGGGAVSGSSISLALADVATCTITNDDLPAHLVVIKHVDNTSGGTAVAGDFTITIAGVTASGGNSFAGQESPGTDRTLTSVGSYSVSEIGPAGYSDSFSADCRGTIALGETKTCVITNANIPAQLTVIKHVVNDSGGTATAADFSVTIGGVTAVGGNTFAGAEAPGVTKTLSTVGAYTVTEAAHAGYTPTYSTDCSGTIAINEVKTCTITNDDIPAQLTLAKTVVNDDGGTATAGSFTLSATGPTPIDGAGGVSADVSAGTYTLSETAVAGYAARGWSCSIPMPSTNSVRLGLGQDVTCTITNDDVAAQLIVIKHVVGGPNVASDFTMTIGGVTAAGGNSFAGSESGTDKTLTSVGAYSVTETAAPHYLTDRSADCDGTIALGETKTCTITNTYNPAYLTLVKTVNNTGGGTTAPTAWTLSANGPTPVSGATGSTSVTHAAVTPGTYLLSESGGTGTGSYLAGSWSCAPELRELSVQTALLTGSSLTLNDGDHVTCTITNTYVPYVPPTGNLVVVKYNDLNGSGTRDTNEPILSGVSFGVWLNGFQIATLVTDASGSATMYSVAPGTYTLIETVPAGWYNTDPAGANPGKTATVTANQTTTVVFGDRKVEIPPTSQGGNLTVTKYEDTDRNGQRGTGEAGLAGWVFTVRNSAGELVTTLTTDATGSATATNLAPGVYRVSETTQTGWVSTDPTGTAPYKDALVEDAQTITTLFGNAKVQLPSTATDAPGDALLVLIALFGLAAFATHRIRIQKSVL